MAVGPSQERLLTMSRYFSINRPRWYNCSIMTAKGLERQASTALAPDKGTCGRYCRVLVECASWHPASRDVELDITAGDFRQSLTATDPPAGLTHALAGVWDAKGDWTRAHESAQRDEGPEGSWVHAYLYRKG